MKRDRAQTQGSRVAGEGRAGVALGLGAVGRWGWVQGASAGGGAAPGPAPGAAIKRKGKLARRGPTWPRLTQGDEPIPQDG
jgi:hypothetical protein